ncbi:hypothetical protein EDB85DRAFT_1931444, partial [Lactarius pseudohatsudake]
VNEDDTTSSSRIFVKIMIQEVTESMGLPTLKERFADQEIKALRDQLLYFTSFGLGALTGEMREHLKNAPRLIMEQRRAMLEAESSSSDSSSDTDSGILSIVGATTAAHHLRLSVLVGTSGVADAMTVAHRHHLAPGGMTIEGTTRVVVMDGTVANPLRGVVGAVFRIQGPLVGATTARVSVRRRRHRGRVGETVIETVITTAEDMTRGTDTGIAGAE